MNKRGFTHGMRLVLAIAMVFALGIASGIQAKTGNSKKKPILTKAGQKEAIWTAAQAVLAAQPQSFAASATDPTTIPHYFGPFANWANSPYTLADVAVTINGNGTGATAAAKVGGNGAITGINITNPGHGYASATVSITSATGSGATATATVTPSGIVSGITLNAPGAGYTGPTVTIAGGIGAGGDLAQVGNPLIDRAIDSDFDIVSPNRIFVLIPSALPAGTLKAFMSRNQAILGVQSAGNKFHAYLLRPVAGESNQYTVVLDSGTLTVPPLTVPGVSEIVSYPVADTIVQAGDRIAFYGSGIPFDYNVGNDSVAYVAPVSPVQGATITVGSASFPLITQPRTYSFGVNVVTAGGGGGTGATATAYGGVDTIFVTNGGSGYTLPTIDFDMPDDPNGVSARAHVASIALGDSINGLDVNGTITAIVVDSPGSGYAAAPNIVIRDGTVYDPVPSGGTGATANATLSLQYITLNTFGSGYLSAPTVTITDPTGTGAAATAIVTAGGVTAITLTAPGTGYVTVGGIKKFQDGLPVLCIPGVGQTYANCTNNNLGQHIPIAIPDTTTFAGADYYVIGVVQHRERMSSSLPATGALMRQYVQLETSANAAFSKHVALQNALLDGTSTAALMPGGAQAYAVDDPHFLGPIISSTKDKPVRIVFYNLLPTGTNGDLFLPTDSTLMGSGLGPAAMPDPIDQGTVLDAVRNPECTQYPKSNNCFKDNRATLHLHGGTTPWISDGTPHQWITPANQTTAWPQGVSVSEVPDMVGTSRPAGVPDCSGTTDGCQTFYYTNQQSARLLFYHDHAWGITRLNVYAGEAAGYLITDPTEQALISTGVIPSDQIPLVIQDRTFVPNTAQLAVQDPTWDSSRWGGLGNLWYHHVYMTAQNPGDPSGMSAYGRWMYGPWFWPPAGTAKYQPIANPYYNPACNLDDPATWTYQTDPFCEPPLIPGTPNISVGMEQFNDTPIVNGTAYPTTTVQPKSYRLRVLNAANDRFWNLQWYIADPTTGTDSEVALNPAELAAAQTDPVVVPTAVKSIVNAGQVVNLEGPDWIQIGTEGGFLPAPVVVDGQQVTTWITDPTRFDVGNVDLHSLLLAPAERADVIVDFSKFAGKTLILYNDAPAAFPARVPSYDYYTGAPDLSPVGAPSILPGYGPNTRTIMQVKVAAAAPAPAFNLTALQNAFKHKANGSGVFESSQHPIIVGQAAYNSAYGTTFPVGSWCNAPGSTSTSCDGMARISEQGGNLFGFNTLAAPTTKLSIKLEPKAIHDEMNASAFDEFGRMQANLGLEAVPANPAAQNIILYPYVNPSTELIDATNLPKGDLNVSPITSADGTQIWKITHNGVDTHPIHFHLYDVQIVNRVTWDNIIIPTEASELGWKDTIRVSPLEDTIVALRPIIPTLPFELPNSIRMLNPMAPAGSTALFSNIDAAGNPTALVTNQLVNFGWEYVWHCHILSHEEMDMMRPVSVAIPPIAPSGLASAISGNNLTLTWDDNSISETSFTVQRMTGTGPWVDLGTIQSPLNQPNTHGSRSFTDSGYTPTADYQYRVAAKNTVGYGGAFMSLTVQSTSAPLAIVNPPAAPTALTATLQTGPQISLTWTDNATNETGFILERSVNGGAFQVLTNPPAHTGTGFVTFVDTPVTAGTTYAYQVRATNTSGPSGNSNTVTLTVPAVPTAPSSFTATNGANQGNLRRVVLNWTDNSNNETGFSIQRATNAGFTTGLNTVAVGANVQTFTQTGLTRNTNYYFRIRANNGSIISSGWVNATPLPIQTNP
jgi:FtsP/CotA-like multicopper oxidase with cupredoxin domain